MKNIFKYLLVLVAIFAVALTTVNAAKDEKKSDEVTTTDKTDDAKDETTKAETKSKQKIKYYLFRQTGCGYCAREMQYLDSIYDKYSDKIEIVVYNIYDGDNRDLLIDVADKLNTTFSGVPFAIVGDKYVEGYAEQLEPELISMIENGYKNQVKDIVAETIKSGKYKDLKPTTLAKAMDSEQLEHTSKADGSKKSNDTVIIAVFFGVIVLGLGALVYFSRRK